MHLKSLTMKGFKSFAEPTTLDLETGVTVVVGPNGSGKSNVVDAIAWVLGAQGPRTVRSGRMDDVIFAGTATRGPLGRAEVSLTIDNATGDLPVDLAEVTIRRTLFRNGDSDYALNGAPCRLLDIQELLSDSGVGRTQHVIIGQGQLDAILNARPEDRRAVIEEAAGILKFRRRKEKAERRLEATAANLVRLSDLLREVRRALRPLERQAQAARRHGELAEELLSLRRHLASRELTALQARLVDATALREALGGEAEVLSATLRRLDVEVATAETELTARGADDLASSLVHLERVHARAHGLSSVLAERRKGVERARAASVDAGVVATLEADAAGVAAELADVEREAELLVPDADRLAGAEATLERERAGLADPHEGDERRRPDRVAEVVGEIAALRVAVERGAAEAGRVGARRAAASERLARATLEGTGLKVSRSQGEVAWAALASHARRLGGARSQLEAEQVETEAAARDADVERAQGEARVEALAAALGEVRARAGVAALHGVEGVLGALVDLVEVDEGWEPAFEAAAAPALASVVVEGGLAPVTAALEVLHLAGSGALLPLGLGRSNPLPPALGEPLRAHVRSRHPGVERALDALLGDAVRVATWPEAAVVATAAPTATVVTMDGACFRAASWQVRRGMGATAAGLDDAQVRAQRATTAADDAARRVVATRSALDRLRDADTLAARRLDARVSKLALDAERLASLAVEIDQVEAEARDLDGQRAEVAERLAGDAERIAELEATLPGLRSAEDEGAEHHRAALAARRRVDELAGAVRSLRTDLEVRATGIEGRRTYLQERFVALDERLARLGAEREVAGQRRVELDKTLVAIDRLAAVVHEGLEVLAGNVADLHERRRRASDAARATADRLDVARRGRGEAERAREVVRERARRIELDAQSVELRVEAVVATLRNDLDCEPDGAPRIECPPLPEGTTPSIRLRDLERELALLGPVNPLAMEELSALGERAAFLEGQLDDVKASRRELGRVVRAVDDEIVEVFVGAYADVSENFTRLFETLFPGGEGSLRLTDPNDPLGTGIEVEARPSGKNVRKLSLLSGGERSLTALAFLFAVFRSRPSPFYVMDEVEAALDDVNLSRFLDLVGEFRREAQLVVVSHQKRTMEVADTLYGVTMQPGGSSRVVSERVASRA